MADETHPIRRLQLMLRDTCRTDDARAEAKRAAQEAGMQLSGEVMRPYQHACRTPSSGSFFPLLPAPVKL